MIDSPELSILSLSLPAAKILAIPFVATKRSRYDEYQVDEIQN